MSSVTLSSEELLATAHSIRSIQRPDGLIARFVGGPADPWNHVEAAIALDLAGLHEDAGRAYGWLARNQLSDGSWFASYGPDGQPDVQHVDTNAVGYVATGVLAHLRSGGSEMGAIALAECGVDAAMGYVLARERGSGVVPWSVQSDGSDAPFALLAGSSSLCSSFVHAAELAELFARSSAEFTEAAQRVAKMVAEGSAVFSDKSEYAMDWYYPVLAGAVVGDAARSRLERGSEQFVTPNGVRCLANQRWVTTAESAEAAIAYARVGDRMTARRLLDSVADKRCSDGSYVTGLVYPERSQFPPAERSTYSAAAVVICADVLARGPASALFSEPVATSWRRLPVGASTSSMNAPDASASR